MDAKELELIVNKQREWITKIMKENRELKSRVKALEHRCADLENDVKDLELIQFINRHSAKNDRRLPK